MLRKDFYYDLPQSLIAQYPSQERDMSRLLVLDRKTGKTTHVLFKNIIDYVKKGDCLVINNTRVIPARLLGEKEDTGGKIEFVLLKNKGDDIKELEDDIRSTGFYRNKARNIIACCKKIISDYDGKVPDTMEKLLTLPGVGRKTANVVLGDVFRIPGIVVDTHAKRLSRRLGLTREEDPVKIEFDLMRIIPKDKWTIFSHMLVFHGRAVCKARNPQCGLCTIRPYCVFGNNKIAKH
jgi:endonuclease III